MLNNVLFLLLGAGLVSIGFLATALAERIRGHHVPREMETEPRLKSNRAQRVTVIPVSAPAEAAETLHPTSTARSPRAARTEPKAITNEDGSDVIAALMAAGYKKPVATAATWACSVAERTTIEGWTTAALRRCALGGPS